MNHAVADVMAFMRIAGQPVRSSPEIPQDPEGAADPVLRLAVAELGALARALKGHASSEKAFRLRLILSEAAELATALVENDLAGVADALADLDYVTIGTAVQFGIPHGAVWDAVQASNLAKFPVCDTCYGGLERAGDGGERLCSLCHGTGRIVVKDAQGKVQKPAGWAPPDIAAILTNAVVEPQERS